MQIEKKSQIFSAFSKTNLLHLSSAGARKNQVGSAFFFVLICMGTWYRLQAGATLTWFLATLILGNPEDPTPTTVHNSQSNPNCL
jgi:hypothetical protein